MIEITPDALSDGCERAHDLFMLNRLRTHEDAVAGFDAVHRALGIDAAMRERLQRALAEMIPVKGLPLVEATALASLQAGVLVGLFIADSALQPSRLSHISE